jgi:hypothetical protein
VPALQLLSGAQTRSLLAPPATDSYSLAEQVDHGLHWSALLVVLNVLLPQAEHLRSDVAVAAAEMNVLALQVVSAVQTRSLAALGAVDSYSLPEHVFHGSHFSAF